VSVTLDPVEVSAPILVELELRRGGVSIGRWVTAVESLDAHVLERLIRDAVRRTGPDDVTDISAYELVVRQPGTPQPLMTFVSAG
jgi:hypothetical protein